MSTFKERLAAIKAQKALAEAEAEAEGRPIAKPEPRPDKKVRIPFQKKAPSAPAAPKKPWRPAVYFYKYKIKPRLPAGSSFSCSFDGEKWTGTLKIPGHGEFSGYQKGVTYLIHYCDDKYREWLHKNGLAEKPKEMTAKFVAPVKKKRGNQ